MLTQVETTIASVSDMVALAAVQAKLARIDVLPQQHLVDAGYVRAPNLVASRDTHQIDLIGPIYEDRQWQAKAGEGFDGANFQVDWERRVVTCPQGRASVSWSEMTTARGRSMVGVHFANADCQACPARSKCTRAKAGYRSLLLQARAEYEAIQEARQRQETAAFKADYGRRAGIEGTLSQGVRAFGLRKARYRGLRRTHLQHVATATAINVGRLSDWLNGLIPISSRRSSFAALAPAC